MIKVAETGRPLKYKTEKELSEAIEKYFKNTPEREWTVTGLAMTIGLDRKALVEYGNKEEFSNTIKKAKEKVQESYEKDLRRYGRSGDIFALKNFGWKDKQEVESTNENINMTYEEYISKVNKQDAY